jgi:protein-S-isoprenylcysteine O-methyltransferase Ste14
MKSWIDIPPVWLALCVALAWLAPRPFAGAFPGWSNGLGWGLVVAAVVLMLWAALFFPLRRTSVIPHRQPKAIIIDGPYRLSRNPIYLADALALLGAALILDSVVGLVLLPIFVLVITRRFVLGEEARLAAAFPDQAAAFFRRTRRWI